MNFHEIEQVFIKKNISNELIENYRTGKRISLSNSEKKKVQQHIEAYSSRLKFLPTINYIILGLIYDKEKTFNTIKRKGILRYSKYLESKNFPENIIKAILNLSLETLIDNSEWNYFKSIQSLSPLYEIMRNLMNKIIIEIKKFSKRPKVIGLSPSLIKSLLALLDLLFLTDYSPIEREAPNSTKFFIKEDISEAISYIIYLKQKLFGINDFDSLVIDIDYISSNEIEAILLPACQLKALQEYEIMIDHFSYKCIQDRNIIQIISPNIQIEKSIRIGYIRTEFQKKYDILNFNYIASLEKICDKFIDIAQSNIFKFTDDNNYPRYIIEIPDYIFNKLSELFFRPKAIFKEEAQYLSIIFKEQFLNYDELNNIKISENLSLFEFFILKRLFSFFYYIFAKKVACKLKTEYQTIIRSLIPRFSKEKLFKFYNGIVSEKAFNEFLEIITWKPSKNSVFDIQYQPFVKINDIYMIPLCTFVHSNSIRNVFASEYKLGNPNIMDNGIYDPISEVLIEAFKQKGFKTFTHINHTYKQGGEIDFLAFKDDFLFIAECKKFIHPCNSYEERTIYDGLIKASSQLDLIIELIQDNNASIDLSSQIKTDIKKFKTIKTSIITNTRLFWGFNLKGHPIRNIYEFDNFLVDGKLRTEDGNYWLWENDYFTLSDLERYLKDDFFMYTEFYNLMLPKTIEYTFGKHKILFETFVLNIDKMKDMAKDSKWRKVE